MKRIKITKDQVKTQREAIMWHLKTFGNITSWEAIKEYGATRLSDIIYKLKHEGNKTTIAKYEYKMPVQYEQQSIIWG